MPRETRHGDWWAAGAAPGVPKAKKVGTGKMLVGRRERLAQEVHALSAEHPQRSVRKNKTKISGGILKGGQPPLKEVFATFSLRKK